MMNHRQHLQNLLPHPPELSDVRGRRRAAVLVPVIEHSDGAKLLLIQRTTHLTNHAGQVAFPGGACEAEDDGMVATALREAEEEVGIAREKVEVAGFLEPYATMAGSPGFIIQPVVGLVPPDLPLTADGHEVAEMFEVPLNWLMNPAYHQKHSGFWRGELHSYYAMNWQKKHIWGATAGIIRGLYERGFAP